MENVRIPCRYCNKAFYNDKTYANHLKYIHRIEK